MHKPALYETANSLQRRDAEYFTEEYSAEIGSMSGRCIDIGSGSCDVAVDFTLPKLEPNSTLVCSDISEAMVNYGKEKYGDNERLSFIQLDIETRNLSEDLVGQFDHVTTFYCLHWCLDLPQAIKNIWRLLKPGGTAFLTLIASSSGLNAFDVLQAMPKYQSYMKDVGRIIPPLQHVKQPRGTFMTLLTSAGFKVRTCSYRAMVYVYDTEDDLKESLLAVSPAKLEFMPLELREEYTKDLLREFKKREIVFNKDQSDEGNCSILLRYGALAVYLEKPSINQ